MIHKTVFISYRRKNAMTARAVYLDLRANGYDVFLDYESINSGDYEHIIFNQIAARAHLVIILTPSAVERFVNPHDLMRREVEYAIEHKRNIVPLLFEGFDFAAAQPYLQGTLVLLPHYNAIEVPTAYFNAAMERLRTRFLNTPLDVVLHPTPKAEAAVVEAKQAADDSPPTLPPLLTTSAGRVPLLAAGGVTILIVVVIAVLLLSGGDNENVASLTQTAAAQIAVQVSDTPLILTDSDMPTRTPTNTNTPTIQPSDTPTATPTDTSTTAPSDTPQVSNTEVTPAPTEIAMAVDDSQYIVSGLNLLSGISPIMDDVDRLLLAEDSDRAVTLVEAYLADHPDDPDGLFALALAHASHYDEESAARSAAQRLIDLRPESAMSYVAMSDATLTYPDFSPQDSRSAIQQAAALEPDNPEVLWRAIRLTSDNNAIIDYLTRAEAGGARGWRFFNTAGNDFYDAGLLDRALPYLEAYYSTPFAQNDNSNRFSLMGALVANGQADRALELAREYESEADGLEYGNIAYIAYSAADNDQARDWAETALVLDAEAYNAVWVQALIAAYVDNDIDAAIALMDAIPSDRYIPTAYLDERFGHRLDLDRARMYRHAGDSVQALTWYESVLNDTPTWTDVREERADYYLELGNVEAARADLEQLFHNAGSLGDTAERDRLLDRLRQLPEATSAS